MTSPRSGPARRQFWDVAIHRQIGKPINAIDIGAVMSVAFSPDGKTLATGSEDGNGAVWNMATRVPKGH